MWFFPISDKNTKEKRIIVRIMAINKRYERVSAVAVAMMGRGKWSTKDYEILARWFKLRREKEEGCFTAGPKGTGELRWTSSFLSVVCSGSRCPILQTFEPHEHEDVLSNGFYLRQAYVPCGLWAESESESMISQARSQTQPRGHRGPQLCFGGNIARGLLRRELFN
ncbi:hypothetical protein AVEN_78653-1 [Araneus ventricosus]|uniref:Uncharacterized protein n=1 Tax=Araneus ventricosus TaxID=182803 RepID=A0A4Y2I9H2_ARAVE|nr:hypothetical protein AVEN_78653-1 [Araneus ventricosus]